MFGLLNTLFGFIIKPKSAFAASKSMENYKTLTDEEWENRLPKDAFYVLRNEGTERPFSSPLNDEKREGVFVVQDAVLLYFLQQQSLTVAQVGQVFLIIYLMQ